MTQSDQPENRERIFLSPPHMSGQERLAIEEVFDSNYVAPAGPFLRRFERSVADFVGVADCVALASGTAAIHLALRNLDLQASDEVFCSTLTFCASANPIVYEGARPCFIDADRQSWNIDPAVLAEALDARARAGRLPKAVIAVDLFGQSVDMDAILRATEPYGVPVIDDAAEALGADYRGRPVGAKGWASVFSFNGNKIITTGGGGMLCSNDLELIDHSRFLATQARDPAPHYQHSAIGFNYRMSNVAAAIGVRQMDALPDRVDARRRVFRGYRELLGDLPGLTFMPEASYNRSTRWLTAVQIDERSFGATLDEVRLRLEANAIESRPVWKPLHLQPVFRDCDRFGGAVSEEIFRRGLCLPSGSAMSTSDIERVAAIVRDCCRGAGRAAA